MKFNQLLSNFSAGEWSPKMRGRSDAQQYANACERVLNFLPQIQGGAFRRPPTKRIELDTDSNTDLQTAVSLLGIKIKQIPVMLANGDKHMVFAIDGYPATEWFYLSATSPASGTLLTTSSAANVTSLVSDITSCQIGDIVFITRNGTDAGLPPSVIYPDTTLKVKTYNEYLASLNYKSVPYLDVQALGSSVNMTAGAATGTTTLTASAAFFNSGHIGAYFKLSSAGSTGVGKVTAYTSTTIVTFEVISTVPTATVGTAATTSWEESSWSDYRGWPRTCVPFQGRLIFGGSKSYPDTIWGTRIGNVFDLMERPFEQSTDFTGFANDNSRPFTLTPNSAEASNIKALSSAKTLMIHTNRSEIVAFGSQGALGPNDPNFESSTSFGASAVMPTRVNNYSVFVEKAGRKLRDMIYNDTEAQYKSSDLSFLADHLTIYNDAPANREDSIVEIIGVSQISSYVFAKTTNGRLISITLDRDYQINAWSEIVLGGSSEFSDFPLVKSMGVVQTSSGTDRIFLVVQRRINGANIMSIEYMDSVKETNIGTNDLEAFYADQKTSYTPDAVDRADSLDHLIGETVHVYADDAYRGDFVVNVHGEIDFGTQVYTAIEVGLPYVSRLITMPVEVGQQIPGSPQGLFKRIDEITLKFWNSYGARYGVPGGTMRSVDFKDPLAIQSDPVQLYSGMKRLKLEAPYTQEAQVIVEQIAPWPCNVTAIIAHGVTYD